MTSCWPQEPLSNAQVAKALSLGVFIFLTIFGNLLVIASVVTRPKLRTPNGQYISSLAVADLLLGIVILPSSCLNEVLTRWPLGRVWCRIWLAMDVFLCTASIYNLVAISFDRFVAITRPLAYASIVTAMRTRVSICVVWLMSLAISVPPMFYPSEEAERYDLIQSVFEEFKEKTNFSFNLTTHCECTPMNNSPGYIIFSAMGSFFIPMTLILIIYSRIFVVIRRVRVNMALGVVNFSTKRGQRDPLFGSFRRRNRKRRSTAGSTAIEESASSAFPEQPANLRVHWGQGGVAISSAVQPSGEGLRVHRGGGASAVRKSIGDLTQDDEGLRVHRGRFSSYKAPKRADFEDQKSSNSKSYSITSLIRPFDISKTLDRRSIAIDHIARDGKRLEVHKHTKGGSSALRKSVLRRRRNVFAAELQAMKTVAIVTGCFIFCWIGFALGYLVQALPSCQEHLCMPRTVFSITFWLGYANSALNPIIYGLFNPEFRIAFQHILCRRYTRVLQMSI